jgi:inosine/xanthosine triphosphate pyrophosphatase family protein
LYKENIMKKDSITMIKLTASEGHILTDGENYGRIVYLASGDEGEGWYEITEAEYQAKMAELEALAE